MLRLQSLGYLISREVTICIPGEDPSLQLDALVVSAQAVK
jgi:hypothetical protein